MQIANNLSRAFPVVFAAVLSGSPLVTYAQEWLALHDQPDAAKLFIDSASVKRVADPYRSDVLDATWKQHMVGPDDWTQVTGRIDCEQASVVVTRKQVHHSWLPDPAHRDVNYDYFAGTKTDWRGTTTLSDSDRKTGEEVLYPADGLLNKVVRHVCGQTEAFADRNVRSGERIQSEAGCDASVLNPKAICSDDVDTREILGRLVLRTTQVHRVCSISLITLRPLIESRLKAAQTKCKDDARCFRSDLGWTVSGFGKDLSIGPTSEKLCRYSLEALEALASEKKREDGIARLNTCAIKSIDALDDRISPADVVARGVFGACRRELTDDLARSTAFESNYLSGLVGAVLYSRQQKARSPSAPSKAKPQKAKST